MEEDGKLAYVLIENAGSSNGDIMPMTEQHGDAPPHWLPYFTVSSCDGAVAKVQELGGDALAGPLVIGDGKIAVLRDPQGAAFATFGAAFATFEGETDE